MGIIADFKKKESNRIDALYEIADKFPGKELDALLEYFLKGYAYEGRVGAIAARGLASRIASAVGLDPSKPIDRIFSGFVQLELEKKKSLLVTVCNDLCKLGVSSESQVYAFLESRLSKIPGEKSAVRPEPL